MVQSALCGYLEIQQQMNLLGIKADYIKVPMVLGTMTGLAVGRKLFGSSEKLIAVGAAKHDANFVTSMVELGNNVLVRLGSDKINKEDFEIDEEHFAPGYEMPRVQYRRQ